MAVFFEDITVGDSYTSEPRTINESDIRKFAELSGDFNPLHVDPEWVQENTDFPGCIAHGLLMISIGSALKTQTLDDWSIHAYLNVDRNMMRPVFPGDSISMQNKVKEVRPSKSKPGSGVVKVSVSLVNQDGVVVQEGTDTYLVGAKK